MAISAVASPRPLGGPAPPAPVYNSNAAPRAHSASSTPHFKAGPTGVRWVPIQPSTVDEVQAILRTGRAYPNGARWAIALALGVTDPIRRHVANQIDGLLWSDDRADPGGN